MAFTYTGALTTDLEKVRRLIGDTDSANALFTDAEINWFISDGGSVYKAAALAARAIAASKALLAKRISEGDFSEDLGSMVSDLLRMAKEWETRALATAGGYSSLTRVDGYSSTIAADSV